MFQQSRVIGELTWANFKRTYADSISLNSSESTIAFGSNNKTPVNSSMDHVIHDSMFELNNYRFHSDLWQAANDDPLTTIYSAVWTLCYTLPPPHSVLAKRASSLSKDSNNNDDGNHGKSDNDDVLAQAEAIEYYTNWYPLVLLHKYMSELARRSTVLKRNEMGKDGQTDLSPTTTSALFAMEQIYKIDRQYLASFDKYRDIPQQEARRLFEEDEETFLRSKLLENQTMRTPYGSVERSSLYEVTYSPLATLLDRGRLSNLFKRTEYVEPLRQQCEHMLVRLFGLQVRVNSWLLPMLRRNEDTSMFGRKLYEEKERLLWEQMVMYWQFQKSELLWFVLHTLFALNDLVADDALTLDLLYFAGDHLERFVECSMCREHWLAQGKKMWKLYLERYAFSEKIWREHQRNEIARMENSKQMQSITRQLQFTRVQSLLDATLVAPDLFMLQTHNEIQTQNVANTKRLTEAALESLRADYRLYAFLLESCVKLDNSSLRDRRSRVDALANARTDVLRQSDDIFASLMLRSLVGGKRINNNNNNNDDEYDNIDARETMDNANDIARRFRRVTLLREKLAYYNLFNGGPIIR